jgi:hypothetical protein
MQVWPHVWVTISILVCIWIGGTTKSGAGSKNYLLYISSVVVKVTGSYGINATVVKINLARENLVPLDSNSDYP